MISINIPQLDQKELRPVKIETLSSSESRLLKDILWFQMFCAAIYLACKQATKNILCNDGRTTITLLWEFTKSLAYLYDLEKRKLIPSES